MRTPIRIRGIWYHLAGFSGPGVYWVLDLERPQFVEPAPPEPIGKLAGRKVFAARPATACEIRMAGRMKTLF